MKDIEEENDKDLIAIRSSLFNSNEQINQTDNRRDIRSVHLRRKSN